MDEFQVEEGFIVRCGGYDLTGIPLILRYPGGPLLYMARRPDGGLRLDIEIHGPDGSQLNFFRTHGFNYHRHNTFRHSYGDGTFKLWDDATGRVICAIRVTCRGFEVWMGNYTLHGVQVTVTPDTIILSHGLTAERIMQDGRLAGILIPAPDTRRGLGSAGEGAWS